MSGWKRWNGSSAITRKGNEKLKAFSRYFISAIVELETTNGRPGNSTPYTTLFLFCGVTAEGSAIFRTIMEKLSSISSLFLPPKTVRGAKILNKEAFKTIINLPALRIEAKKCSLFLKNLGKCLLNQPRMRNIVSDTGAKDKRILLLNPQKSLETLDQKDQEFAKSHGAEETTYDLILGYEHWTAEQVLRAVLPAEISEVPSSFETIGHIAHVNLRDSQLDYKKLIGRCFLLRDKHPVSFNIYTLPPPPPPAISWRWEGGGGVGGLRSEIPLMGKHPIRGN